VDTNAIVDTQQAAVYVSLELPHNCVRHSISEYERDQTHTHGIESFWAMLKRGYHGTYHKMSRKHLHRYVGEFSGRHNIRSNGTIDQMGWIVRNMDGKQLPYKELVK